MSVTLFHRELGGEGRPPLVILHGMLGSSRNWQTAGRDLSDRFHVFALDARNHGQSPHVDSMTYEEMASDVVAWLDEHGLTKVTLMGHSMGGKTAMLLACRHPERVERLIVVDMAPKSYHWVAHQIEFAAMNELELGPLKSRTEAEEQLAVDIDSWTMRKFLATNLERGEDGRWRWIINLAALTAALPMLEKNPLKEGDAFPGPTQFIVGGKSDYVTPPDHEAIHARFSHATIETMADSGHNPHMEAREEFCRLISGPR